MALVSKDPAPASVHQQRQLLRRTKLAGKIIRQHQSLALACRDLGIPRITHHDFRHLFATNCTESGGELLGSAESVTSALGRNAS